MNDASARTVPFGIAAAAAGVTNKSLRSWIDRKQAHLDAEAAPDRGQGWRRFSVLDLFQIALIGRLSELGVPIATADGFAREIIIDSLGRVKSYREIGKKVDALAAKDAAIFFYFDGRKWHRWFDTTIGPPPSAFAYPFLPDGAASWGVVLIGVVFRHVLRRLEDLTEGRQQS